MSQEPPSAAVQVRPTLVVATGPEYGPLVRAQPVRAVEDRLTPLWVGLGIGVSKIPEMIGGSGIWELAGFGALGVGLALAYVAPVFWRRWRLRRCPSWDGTGTAPAGAVRLTGRVRAVGHAFLLPGETRPVVFAKTRYRQARSDGTPGKFQREDVRGLTLEIALSAGASVRIAPDDVRLLEGEAVVPEVGTGLRKRLGAAWEGSRKGKLRRRSLREGDQVEAVGELVQQVNVQGTASPNRGMPMIQWLVPAWPGGVWIRKLEAG
jgi:hypothetical protein